ncbi:MAG: hypothetical protein C5B49_10655 [Bdellovibrio sp.]|nr:MAG: hypothetical protein C5B49_10655 [Bdellovibrio sp.]
MGFRALIASAFLLSEMPLPNAHAHAQEQMQARICLPADGVSAAEMIQYLTHDGECENSPHEQKRERQRQNRLSFEEFAERLQMTEPRKQATVLKDYFHRLVSQPWSEVDLEIALEVLDKWAGLDEKNRPQLNRWQESLRRKSPGAPEGVAYAYRNASQFSFSMIADDPEVAHWESADIDHQPIVYWGLGKDFLAQETQQRKPWVIGTCDHPILQFEANPVLSYTIYFPEGCKAKRPAWLPVRQPGLDALVGNSITPPPWEVGRPKKENQLFSSPWFWGATAAVVLVILISNSNGSASDFTLGN